MWRGVYSNNIPIKLAGYGGSYHGLFVTVTVTVRTAPCLLDVALLAEREREMLWFVGECGTSWFRARSALKPHRSQTTSASDCTTLPSPPPDGALARTGPAPSSVHLTRRYGLYHDLLTGSGEGWGGEVQNM